MPAKYGETVTITENVLSTAIPKLASMFDDSEELIGIINI